MRLRDYWSIIHAWNLHRKHRACLVCIADAWDLSTEGLVLDWVNACAHGSLLTLDEAKGKQPVWIDARTEPITITDREPA